MTMTKNDEIISAIIDVYLEDPTEGVFISVAPYGAAAILQSVPYHPDDFRVEPEKRGFRIWKAKPQQA